MLFVRVAFELAVFMIFGSLPLGEADSHFSITDGSIQKSSSVVPDFFDHRVCLRRSPISMMIVREQGSMGRCLDQIQLTGR